MTAQLSCQTAQHYTPAEYVEAARATLGHIDMDPATCRLANVVVKAPRWCSLTRPQQRPGDDGLTAIWGGRVFVNPPGDRTGMLVRRFWSRANEHALYGGPGVAVLWLGFSLEQLRTLMHTCPPVRGQPCPAPTRWPHVLIARRIRFWTPRWPRARYPQRCRLAMRAGQVVVRSSWTPALATPALTVGASPTHGNYVCLLSHDPTMRERFRAHFGPMGEYRSPRQTPQPAHDLAGDILAVLRSRGPLSKRGVAHLVRRRKQNVFKALDELVARQLVEHTSDRRFGLV
ncbi:MAG: helix-turn-helix domain-containing protein, partial [Myxococcota bacterium]